MEKLQDYSELLEKYRKLELRVTRFSAIEQQLINTRHKLDLEIAMHKRMHEFNSKALKELSESNYSKLVAEAIVDIFEIEIGLILYKYENNQSEINMGIEGVDFSGDYHQLFECLTEFLPENKVVRFTGGNLNLLNLMQAYCIRIEDKINNMTVFLVGGISSERNNLYENLDDEREIIFGVFAQQILAQLLNKKKNITIKNQVENIESTSSKLSKITDAFLNFNTNPTENIRLLLSVLEEVLHAVKVFYISDKNLHINDNLLFNKKNIQHPILNKLYNRLKNQSIVQQEYSILNKNPNFPFINLPNEGLMLGCNVMVEKQSIGSIFCVFNQKHNLNSNEFQILRMFSAGIAVEERRNLSIKELEHSEHRYRSIFNGTPTGILIFENKTFKLRFANKAICKMLGYTENEILNLDIKSLIIADKSDLILSELRRLLNQESVKAQDIPLKSRNGEIFYTDISVYRLMIEGKEMIAAFITDITFRKNATENLIQNNLELKKINSELDNFVYSISHDLRSPLLAIKGLLSLIQSEDAEQQSYIRLIDDSAIRMDETIQEILEYSRNARLSLELDYIDFEKCVADIFASVRYYYTDQMNLILNIDNSQSFLSDNYRLNTLMKNLLGNSVKYKRHDINNSYVKVSLSFDDLYYNIEVEDNGEGIPSDRQNKIFDMFYRGTNTSSGTGLGLYICNEIVQKLNGTIQVFSIPDEITIFSIKLKKFIDIKK